MKNNKFVKNSALILAPLALAMGVLVGVNKSQSTEDVFASSYSTSPIPTNLDLNDVDGPDVRAYYSDLVGKGDSQLSGTNLLKNLKPILKKNQKYLSYGTGPTTAVWQAYEIVDRDWIKSPASKINGYDPTTNTVTNYVYGTSNSSVGSNPYIHALYINRNVENETRAWGNHNQNQWGINQEHVWAKSCGFEDTSKGVGARGDLMHLWAGNGKVNGVHHSNYYYGYVDKNKDYDDAGDVVINKVKCTNLSGNLKGLSKTKGGSYTVFEPQDSDKGDIARAIFYMVARYNYLSGSDSDGIDAGNPNLELTNELNWTGPTSTSYTSSTSVKGQMGILQDLLEWNRLDPPDQWEIHRNNILYRNFTSNRNPFIDFPEWAEYIWGKSVDGSYSSTSTGVANPTSNVLNGFSGGGAATVSSVAVAPSTLTLNLSGTTSSNLSATVSGTNNPSQEVTWKSSNSNIASVNSSGVVTAKAVGSCTITATSTLDTTKSGTCSVTVQNQVVAVTGVELNKESITIEEGSSETLNETVLPTTASNKAVSWSVINANPSGCVTVNNGVVHGVSEGTATVVVTTNDGSFTASCAVTVSSNQLSNVVFAMGADGEASHSDGSTVSSTTYSETQSGITLSLVNGVKMYKNARDAQGNGCLKFSTGSDNGSFDVDLSDVNKLSQVTFRVSNYKANSGASISINGGTAKTIESKSNNGTYDDVSVNITNQTTLSVSFTGRVMLNEIEFVFNSPVSTKTLVDISLNTNNVQTAFSLNDTFNHTGLVVTAYYDDESDDDVSEFIVSSPDMSTAGQKTVTVSYTYGETTKTASYQITVTQPAPEKGTENNPYTVAEARSAIDSFGTLSNKYTEGIIYRVDSYNSTYHSITYWISDDGSNSSGLQIYGGLGLNGAGFSSKDDLSIGDTVVVKGNLKKYNSTYEYDLNSEIVSLVPATPVSEDSNQYSLITDVSQLLTGDTVIIVGVYSSTYYTMSGISNDVMACTTLSTSNSDLIINSSTMAFTIEKSKDGYRFRNSSNQYLATCSSTSNQCALESGTPTDNSLFNISYSNGTMSVVGVDGGDYTKKTLQYNYNSGKTPRFAFYGTASCSPVSIYKKTTQVSADAWSQTFLNSTSDGEKCNVDNWFSLASSYNALSDGAKSEIINVEANSSLYYSYRAQAMARYDYFMSNPNYNQGDHFIVGRASSLSNRPSIQFNENNGSDNLIFITICVVVSLTSLTTLLIIKKRKNIRA